MPASSKTFPPTLNDKLTSCIIELAYWSSAMQVSMRKQSFKLIALDSFLWSCMTMEQYWNTATSKLVGNWVTSMMGTAVFRSGAAWLWVSVLLGDGGALDSACVWARVVIKFRFRWMASYRASSSALLARICCTRSTPSSDTNMLPTMFERDENQDEVVLVAATL